MCIRDSELFGGYLMQRASLLAHTARRLPPAALRALLGAAQHLPVSNDKIGFEYKLKRFLEGCQMPAARAHAYWSGTFDDQEKRSLLQSPPPAALDAILSELAGEHLQDYLWFDQKYFLPDNILTLSLIHIFRKEWVVLDALNYIKDHLDGSLSFRWSCRMGVCGSCGMTVNGVPKLTCATFLSDYAPGPVRIEPMKNFPVLRDLVVDTSDFLLKLAKSKPWIIRQVEKPLDEEYFQTPEQLEAYKQFSMCINCMLCYAACPVYGLDPLFSGPAAIALAQRYNLDSRDQGASERLDILSQHDGIWGCTFVGECTEVCPKKVDPAGAIQQYKLTATMEWVKSLVLPRGAE